MPNSDADVPANASLPQAAGAPSKLLGLIGFVAVGLLSVGGLFTYQNWATKPPPERAESLGAKLELAAGDVVLLRADDTTNGVGERLLSGTPLPLGASIRTGEGSRALVRLSDGSRVFLNESSAIAIGEDRGITVNAGQVWLETQPLDPKRDPLVHTVGPATLTLSDGGASLTLTEDGASVYVAEGVGWVTGVGGPKEVRTGEQALIGVSGAPQVEPVALWDDWTGGMADRRSGARIGGGSGSLYAVDRSAPAGTPALPLSISSQIVDIAIEPGLAETRVDQRFFNDSERDVEGWYWFTIPEGATLVGFELETNGKLVAGEIVEKQQAVATYESAIVSNDNPALLEWIDERTVRARIYPVPSLAERRIVVRYQQLLSEDQGKLRYSYPLAGGGGRDTPTIEEFSLAVELRGELSQRYTISTLDEATVSNDDALVTMRRTGYTPRADFEIELTRKPTGEGHDDASPDAAALRLSQYDGGADQAKFVMLRWIPDLDFAAVETPRADVVVVVDTSAFGDDAEYQTRIAVAEALLRSLSRDDKFALMSADLTAEVLFPSQGLAAASPEAIDAALAVLRAHRPGGASDLGAIFEHALTRVHEAEQPAIVYVGDGLATSGERGADALAERLRRALTDSRARLFTVGVGPAVEDRLLARLARVGGGESLRVESADQAVVRALELSGALKTPTITDLEFDLGEGLDDRLDNATGKLARGQELVILARTHHELPASVHVRGRLGGQEFDRDYPLARSEGALDHVVPKLWAAARIERLLGDGRGPDAVRGKVLALGLEYGLMTPFTSFLALESENAYARKGIERRDRPWDFELLGAALPHTWERLPNRELGDSPSAGELLLGALMAPIGCSAPPDQAASADRSENSERQDDRVASMASSPDKQAKHEDATVEMAAIDGEMGEKREMEEMEAPSAEPDPAPMADAAPEEGMMGAARNEPAAPTMRRPSAKPERLGDGDGSALGGGEFGGRGQGIGQAHSTGSASGKKSAERKGGGGSTDFEQNNKLDKDANVDELDWRDAIDAPDLSAGNVASEKSRPAPKKRRPKVVSPVARNQKLACSDASARSLAQRKTLWEQRLVRSPDMIARLRAYENAAASCELENWKQQRVFLSLLQAEAETEAEIELLLAHFDSEVEAKAFLARALLRRLVEPGLIGAVERSVDGGSLDSDSIIAAATRATSAERALALVDEGLAKHADASDDERLPLILLRIDLLFELRRIDEAIAAGRKLRERGLITPMLARKLGELLVEAGEADEAKRVFSEIVEYDPSGEYTRRLLGDIFLRHGWYQEAYRQYQDLVALTARPTDVIRLARAAAGASRVDEALRLLRQVASGEGRPGIEDPRRFARVHAAVLLASLLATEPELGKDEIERELERLQLFKGPTTWTFLTWSDLEQELTLGLEPLGHEPSGHEITAAKRAALRVSQGREAGDTGVWAIQAAGLEDLIVRHRGEVPNHAVSFERLTVRWDGEHFDVERTLGTIAAKAAREGGLDEGEGEGEDEGGDGQADKPKPKPKPKLEPEPEAEPEPKPSP